MQFTSTKQVSKIGFNLSKSKDRVKPTLRQQLFDVISDSLDDEGPLWLSAVIQFQKWCIKNCSVS